MRRGLLVGMLVAGGLLVVAPAADAHPLGNFTVNTADRLVVTADEVRVQHVVDSAEIPTLQLAQSPEGPDADRDGRTSDAELAGWSARECARIAPQLSLVLDGSPAPLTVAQASARTPAGQAGLVTSRLECTYGSARPARATVAFHDPTSAGRTGWKEVSAAALCGALVGADVPGQSASALLTAYPQDLLSSPPATSSAAFRVRPGGGCRADGSGGVPAPSAVLPRGVDRLTRSYASFVGRQDLTLPVALAAVLLSVLLGCAHAVAPGHGKTVIAAYLVGQRGTTRQAVWLGATVTATHTAGVLLLGALLSLTAVASPERYVPAAEVASGLLLAAVGGLLLRRAVRARAAGQPHDHDLVHGHDHDPGHGHDHPQVRTPAPQRQLVVAGAPAAAPHADSALQHPHAAGPHSHGGRPHSHLPAPDTAFGWRTLATMGIAGGLVPSPSALVVLLGAAALGRPVFGGVLVVGYGVGMALTLTLAGLLLLRARARLDTARWATVARAPLVRALPALTAAAVLLVGAVVVLRGLLTLRGLG